MKSFLNGVACFSKPWTSKSKTLHAANITFTVKEGSFLTVDKMRKCFQGIISCSVDENWEVNISGWVSLTHYFRLLRKFDELVDIKQMRWGESPSFLVKKKQVPSSKQAEADPSTNNSDPATDHTITADGECEGNATQCSRLTRHHDEKPMTSDKTQNQSSEIIVQEPAGSC